MQYKAFVNDGDESIKWLTVSSDEEDTGGFFVFYHRSEHDAFDTWHLTLADALDVGADYGIACVDWRLINDDRKCAELIVHEVFNTSRGVIGILDFPPEVHPLIGMLLLTKRTNEIWTVKGIAMPVFVEDMTIEIASPYHSVTVTDCLLAPAIATAVLQQGDLLTIK